LRYHWLHHQYIKLVPLIHAGSKHSSHNMQRQPSIDLVNSYFDCVVGHPMLVITHIRVQDVAYIADKFHMARVAGCTIYHLSYLLFELRIAFVTLSIICRYPLPLQKLLSAD
jgi:hypothetical protein